MVRPDGPFDLARLRRPGAPRVERLGTVPADLDLHALALALECPALIERGDAPRESWHVLPICPQGVLDATAREIRIAWLGDGGGTIRREGRGLDALRDLLDAIARPRPDADIPFAGGLVVLLGYDLAHEIERLPSTTEDRDGLPRIHACACAAAVLVPCRGGEALLAWLPGEDAGGPSWGLTADEAALHATWARRAIREPGRFEGAGAADHDRGRPLGMVQPLWSQRDHEAAVESIVENERAGEIYQANVTQRFEIGWEGSALPLHAVLRRTNPSPFSGWIRGIGSDWQVVSGSPERLVRLRGRELLTEPIKGTVALPRGSATTQDEAARLGAQLVASEKDRAELTMIVDLHRNDLGRVSAPGSVRVEEMLRLDRRSHVVQAIADIRGTLAEGKDAVDVIEAMFPGGSVTGVPKIRAMELLDGLERWSRGPYTGSFGFVSPWGDMDLNILIRSAWQADGRLAFAAGGGIVLDSHPTREYEESLAKVAAMREAVETLRTGDAP